MTERTGKEQLIEYATGAKQFIANADVDPVPDEMLMRAAVVYHMLERQGVLKPVHEVPPLSVADLVRPHCIAPREWEET